MHFIIGLNLKLIKLFLIIIRKHILFLRNSFDPGISLTLPINSMGGGSSSVDLMELKDKPPIPYQQVAKISSFFSNLIFSLDQQVSSAMRVLLKMFLIIDEIM